jgi:hypothetical protein
MVERFRSTVLWGFLAALLAAAAPACAADTAGPAAFLFAYHVKPGMQPQFDEGYRRHLQWHQEKKDQLVWYGWYVATGEQTGLFLDGSFGIPFADFDHRVELQADAADFTQNAAPFSDTAFRSAYRLRKDLSTGQPLEDRQPSPTVEVVHYVLHPGMEHAFEEVVAAWRAALLRRPGAPVQTWYQLVVGGEQPSYMLMVPRQGWADYDRPGSLEADLAAAYGAPRVQALLKTLAGAVDHVRSETWAYRKDLSYFPARP